MRPVTAATLLVAFGVLAALPFRRDGKVEPEAGPSELLSGPRRDAVTTLRTAPPAAAGEGLQFDPSLAWQPVPISLPEWTEPELPPMPHSYYDTAFELEQPDPIRQRFSAAAERRGPAPIAAALQPGSKLEPGKLEPGKLASSRGKPPAKLLQVRPEKLAEALTGDAPENLAGHSPEDFAKLPQAAPAATPAPGNAPPRTAHDLLQDRFVYSPIPSPAEPPSEPDAAPRQTPAQRASLVRSGLAADDPQRPRHFIREPQ